MDCRGMHYVYYERPHKQSIMRETVAMKALLRLVRLAAEQYPAVEGNLIQLKEEEIPELSQSAVNLLLQEGISRYAYEMFSQMGTESWLSIGDYYTTTIGIMYDMLSVRVAEVNMQVSYAEEDKLTGVEGDVKLWLDTKNGERHEITVTFNQ